MKKILFHELDLSDFKSLVQEVVNSELKKYFIPSERELPSEYIDIEEAAKLLNLSRQTLYQSKQIPRNRVNGRLLFKRSRLIDYIENNGKLPSIKL